MLDVPREVPVGKAQVIIRFPVSAAPAPAKKDSKPESDAKSATPHADFLSGICASAGNITLEQIREERLSKYLK